MLDTRPDRVRADLPDVDLVELEVATDRKGPNFKSRDVTRLMECNSLKKRAAEEARDSKGERQQVAA